MSSTKLFEVILSQLWTGGLQNFGDISRYVSLLESSLDIVEKRLKYAFLGSELHSRPSFVKKKQASNNLALDKTTTTTNTWEEKGNQSGKSSNDGGT